ncbi:MAG: DUF6691 family protein [Actinomycetota bacterium]
MSTSKTSGLNGVGLLCGALFGGILAGANLHEYDSIHAFLKLDDLYIAWFMGSAILVSAPLLWWLERRGTDTPFGGRLELSRARPERRHVTGGAIFGLGWATAGTCPAPALVMISSGAMLGLVALAGIFVGLHLRERQVMRDLDLTEASGVIAPAQGVAP